MSQRGGQANKWCWPKGERLALSAEICLEDFEFHSQFQTQSIAGKVNHYSRSFGDYGWSTGVHRLLGLLDELDIKGHAIVNGLVASRHPDVVAMIAEAGHEIAGHGWANDVIMSDDSPDAELQEIQRCTRVLTDAAGTRPVGWTSPGLMRTRNTFELLRGEGYLWSGDDASADLPFLEETRHGPLVIVPRGGSAVNNDLNMWLAPRNAPSDFWEVFKEGFDQLYSEAVAGAPNKTELTMHCHISGRPTLIPTMRRCLAYAKQHEGIWFAPRRKIAEWTLTLGRDRRINSAAKSEGLAGARQSGA